MQLHTLKEIVKEVARSYKKKDVVAYEVAY